MAPAFFISNISASSSPLEVLVNAPIGKISTFEFIDLDLI